MYTVVCFHLDAAGGGKYTAAIASTSLAVRLVEFARVVKNVFTFRLRPVDRRADKATDRLHCNLHWHAIGIINLASNDSGSYCYSFALKIPAGVGLTGIKQSENLLSNTAAKWTKS